MSLPRTVRAATLDLQVVIAGRVRDGLTNGAPVGALTVELRDRDTGAPYPLRGRVLDDGSFAFYGRPETAFPLLAERTYRLQVVARAPRYQEATIALDLGPVAGQPAIVSQDGPLGLRPMTRTRFTGGGLPRAGLALTLGRVAVRLRGRVHVAGDPEAGVDAATVQVTTPPGPSGATDAAGRFLLPGPLPLAQSVRLTVSKAGFQTATLTLEPDYTVPVNAIQIGLARS